jgi:3-oxoacyl-[acyl-carrier protein] reductase
VGCSREPSAYTSPCYEHFCLDVSDEAKVKSMFGHVRKEHKRLDVLINNAGIASMNHTLLTPLATVRKILETNVVGSFLFCREAAKAMMTGEGGRVVNFSTVATPLRLEGEAVYAASKAAINTLTQILAREFATHNITINAVGPTPIQTDLIGAVPEQKIKELLQRQAIPRLGEFSDIANVIDFFIRPESRFVTGQIVYLGGVS